MHITKEQLNDYMAGRMQQAGQIAFFEHISECEFCAGKLANAMQMQENQLVFTPPDLKSTIIEQTVYRPINLSHKVVKTARKNNQKEFWIYTAKVAFAVCAAVTIIMTPSSILLNNNDSNERYRQSRLSLTKEITQEDAKNNLKILDLFRNTSAKISDNVFKVLKMEADYDK